MIEAYLTNASVTTGNTLLFTNTYTQTASTVLNSSGSAIDITTPGIYKVDFTAIATSTLAGDVAFNLVISGNQSQHAFANTSVSATDNVTLNFSTLVKVINAPVGNLATLSVVYSGVSITIPMADIVVTKVA